MTDAGQLFDRAMLDHATQMARLSPEPIGCGAVIVSTYGDILATEFNSQRLDDCAINHAEIKAVVAANSQVGSRTLEGATAYCSCEPCTMCLTALSLAKVTRIVFRHRMRDLFPSDRQSRIDPWDFVRTLNFIPNLTQIEP